MGLLDTRIEAVVTAIKNKFNAVHGGASNSGNTLKKLEDHIVNLEQRVTILEGGGGNGGGGNGGGIPKAANLVAWWKMDEITGTRVNSANPGVLDLSVVDGGYIGASTGIIGNAATGLSSANHFVASDASSIRWDQDCSILIWSKIEPLQMGQQNLMMYLKGQALFDSLEVAIYPHNLNLPDQRIDGMRVNLLTNEGMQYADFTVPLNLFPVNTFTCIIVTHNVSNKRIRLYINGTKVGSDFIYSGTVVNMFQPIKFGMAQYGYNTALQDMDETAFWNTELDAADVVALYNNGNAITYN